MSFLFGKKKTEKQQNAAPTPPPGASRDIASSHGPSNSGSMIPTPNGIPDPRARAANQTPTPGSGSVNNSMSSLQSGGPGPRSVDSPEPKGMQPRDEVRIIFSFWFRHLVLWVSALCISLSNDTSRWKRPSALPLSPRMTDVPDTITLFPAIVFATCADIYVQFSSSHSREGQWVPRALPATHLTRGRRGA